MAERTRDRRGGWSRPAALLFVAAAAALASPPPSVAGATASWANPERVNIDRSGDVRSAPALAVEASGTLHAVWIESDPSGDQVRYATRASPAVGWSASLRVSSDTQAARFDPDLAVDSAGRAHAFWVQSVGDGSRVMHAQLARSSRAWSPERPIDAPPGRTRQWSPAAAADRAGNVHVLWEDYRTGEPDVLHRRLDPDGRWSPIVVVHSANGGDQREPDVVDTPQGELVAVWQDSRDGTADVYASRLPQFGDLWWPDARISSATPGGASERPAVACDAAGRVVAVWHVSGGAGSLRAAELLAYDPERPYWRDDREVYRPSRGAILAHAIGGGPGRAVTVAWSESRPDGSRIYGADLRDGALLEPVRVDVSLTAVDGRTPAVVVDIAPRAHIVWRGTARDGGLDVFHAWTPLERPAYPAAVQQGWLQYVPLEPNCGSDGYVAVSCDGIAGPLIRPGDVALDALLGSHVSVEGEAVDEGACPHTVARRAVLSPSSCPRETGSVTGYVRYAGAPVEAAVVSLGELAVTTGPSGRFFLDLVPPGTHGVTATAACALSSVLPAVTVPRGFLATVPPAELVLGDVVADCRIDIRDLVRVGAAHKSRAPFTPPCVDLDRDGEVSVADLAVVGAAYGRSCPVPWGAAAGGHAAAAIPADVPDDAPALVLTGARRVRAWSLEVEGPSGGTWPSPPFDQRSMPPGVWIAENEVDDRGAARLAAVLLAPNAALGGGAVLARSTTLLAGRASRVTARLVDDAGRPAAGTVVVAAASAPASRAYLPRAERRPTAPWSR
jgi:hypothetical protein